MSSQEGAHEAGAAQAAPAADAAAAHALIQAVKRSLSQLGALQAVGMGWRASPSCCRSSSAPSCGHPYSVRWKQRRLRQRQAMLTRSMR